MADWANSPITPFSPSQIDWTKKGFHEGTSLAAATPNLGDKMGADYKLDSFAGPGNWDKMPLKIKSREEYLQLPVYEQMRELSKAVRGKEEMCAVVLSTFREMYLPSTQVAKMQQDKQFVNPDVIDAIIGKIPVSEGEALANLLQLTCMLSRNSGNIPFFIKDNGLTVILDSTRSVNADRGVIREGLRALVNLSSKDECKGRLIEDNAGSFVLDLIRENKHDPNLLQDALRMLRNLTLHGKTTAKVFVESGAAELVIEIMGLHQQHSLIQQVSCACLCNMAVLDKSKVKLVEQGAVEAVIRAMDMVANDAKLHQEACRTLGNLAANPANKIKLGKGGAGESVIQSMKLHAENPRTVEMACRALAYLSANPENQKQLVTVGALSSLRTSCSRHMSDARVIEHGLWAICNIASDGDNKNVAVKEGVIDLVLQSMGTHPRDSRVQQEALRTLCNLAANSEIRVVLTESGCVGAVVKTMREMVTDARVQELACSAILSIKRHNKPAKALFLESGGRDLALCALQTHNGVREVRRAAHQLLGTESREWPAPKKAFLRRIGFPLLALSAFMLIITLAITFRHELVKSDLAVVLAPLDNLVAPLWSGVAVTFVLCAMRVFK